MFWNVLTSRIQIQRDESLIIQNSQLQMKTVFDSTVIQMHDSRENDQIIDNG